MIKTFVALALVSCLFLASCSKDETALSFTDQLTMDLATIDSYLASNGISAKQDSSNFIRYNVTSEGTGIKPALPDSIRVNYSLRLLSGQQIEKTAAPATFFLGYLIPGWQVGLPLIAQGSKFSLYVPSGLAYGSTGKGSIPANSNLVFDIELIKVIPEYKAQLKKDEAIIDAYLAVNNITKSVRDATGLRYVIDPQGGGVTPSLTDSVVVKYKGKILSSGVTFDESSVPKEFLLSKTVAAWKVGLPFLKQGGKMTLYVPSGVGYGAYGTTETPVPIPPATNLIYDIELIRVKKN